jgi:hypothetical protein
VKNQGSPNAKIVPKPQKLWYKFAMFKPICRFLLIFLLLLAIPFRGFAASSMVACIPDAGTAMQDHHQNQPKQHGQQHEHEHQHPHEHEHQSGLAEQASHTDQSQSNPDELDAKAKCNHCAPCCLAFVLNSHPVQTLSPPAGIPAFPTLTEALHSALVRNLERPPQLLLL